MNKEELDINQELEQMRQDYAALKERFDKQQIINDRLMEKAFKSDVRWLSADKLSGLIAGALGIPFIIAISIINNGVADNSEEVLTKENNDWNNWNIWEDNE